MRPTTAEHLVPGDTVRFLPNGADWHVKSVERVQVQMAPPVFHRVVTVNGGIQFQLREDATVDLIDQGFGV